MGIDQILTPFIRSNVAISLVVALSLPACSSGRVELPTCQDKVEYGDECVYSLDDFEKNEFDKLVRVAEIYEPYFVAVGSLANNSDRLASWKELDFLESLDLTYEALFSWKVQDDGNSNNGEILVGQNHVYFTLDISVKSPKIPRLTSLRYVPWNKSKSLDIWCP